jgi:molybdopterin synthase sulfur carrier subunit
MVTVEFLGPIGHAPVELEAKSLMELAEALKGIEGIESWLNDSAVAINDAIISDRNAPLQDGDRVSILPPVCGG